MSYNTRSASSSTSRPTSSSDRPPAPAPGPSSTIPSSSSSSSSSSYRVLEFVNNLRTNTEQATKQLNELLTANESVGEALKKEKNEERRLLKEMQSILELTKATQNKVTQLQGKLLDLEARRGALTWQKATVKALEAEASKSMEAFKYELAQALAKHQPELEVEVGKAVALHAELGVMEGELAAAEKGLEAAREERGQSKAKLKTLEEEREALAQELRAEQKETQRLKQQVLPQLAQEITETEENMCDVEAMKNAYMVQNKKERQRRSRGSASSSSSS